MTRRMITIKWVFYSLWTLLFLLAQQLVLPHIRLWGVHPFLLPVLAAVAASYAYGAPLTAALWLIARELAVTLPAAVLIHPVFSRIHRRFAGR